jgi:rhodanese-related sulfurtransferase
VLLYCAGGYRSSIGASVVQQRRIGDVSEIAGGLAAWEAAGLPLETGLEPNEQPEPEREREPEPNPEP